MKSWTVDVDDVAHTVEVHPDEQSGRAAIRVDGRMAGRAMQPDEQERVFGIGSAAYVLRRNTAGSFDLDLAIDQTPEVTLTPAPLPPKTLSQRLPVPMEEIVDKPPVGKYIFAIVATCVIAFTLRWGWDAMQYLHVPWKHFYSADHAWKVDFPGDPQETRKSFYIKGETYDLTMYHGVFRKHAYFVEPFALPVAIPPEKAGELLDAMLDGIIRETNGTVISRQAGYYRGADSLSFIAQVPRTAEHPPGTARGRLVVSRQLVLLQMAFTPKRGSISYDVGEFLRSLELAEVATNPNR
jgi:hypothetical protein